MHHRIADREYRQYMLNGSYMFKCDCYACKRDYPKLTLQNMPKDNGFVKPLLHLELCGEYKLDAIKQLIPIYRGYLNAHSTKYYPKNYTNIVEKILFNFWNVVYLDNMSLTTKRKLGVFNKK